MSASAQIVFTVKATADANGSGYLMGQEYTFTFTTGSSYGDNSPASSSFDSTSSYWTEFSAADQALWSSIGGDGVNGTFARTVNPSAYVTVYQSGNPEFPFSNLGFSAGDNGGGEEGPPPNAMGLKTLNNEDLYRVSVSVEYVTGLPSFNYAGTYSEPFDSTTGYFASYFGTYTSGFDSNDGLALFVLDGSPLNFTLTELSIGAASAVPEPSTYAGLAGLAALGFVVLRRRRAGG